MKTCSKCKIEKSESEFHKDKSKISGLCSQCNVCRDEIRKQFRLNNPEKVKKYDKISYQNNKEYHKKYYQNNAGKRSEYYKAYYKNKTDRVKENAKRYWENNKEKIIERRNRKLLLHE